MEFPVAADTSEAFMDVYENVKCEFTVLCFLDDDLRRMGESEGTMILIFKIGGPDGYCHIYSFSLQHLDRMSGE